MKRNKLIIIMISVIAIGLFALPSTFSYSGSMHTFKQIDPTSADTINAFCMKCHTGAISEQLAASDNALYQGGGPIHQSVQCQGCHQITRTVGEQGYGIEPTLKHIRTSRVTLITILNVSGAIQKQQGVVRFRPV